MRDHSNTLAYRLYPSGDFSFWRIIVRLVQRPKTPSSLGLSNLTISRNASKPTPVQGSVRPFRNSGCRGLTRLGALRVRSGAAILERLYERGCLSFFTGTLPVVERESLHLAAGVAGKVLHRFFEAITRLLRAAGLPGHFVWVAELQSRGALHWHAVWVGRQPRGGWAVTTQQLDAIWQRVWSKYEWARDFSYASSCNVQRVKKSVTGYLSKYISKGRGQDVPVGVAHPRQWWGMSDTMRELISQQTVNGTMEVYRNTFSWYSMLERVLNLPGLIFANLKTLDTGVTVCCYGRLAALATGKIDDIIDFFTWEAARERLTRSGWPAQQPAPPCTSDAPPSPVSARVGGSSKFLRDGQLVLSI